MADVRFVPVTGRLVTPWGDSQTLNKLAPGVLQVTTSTHGGIFVKGEAATKLSAAAKAEAISQYGGYWFEEDCDAAIVINEMPDLFTERDRKLATESLKRWNDRYLANLNDEKEN